MINHTKLGHLAAALTAAACLGLLTPIHAKQPKPTDCWLIELDSVETGKVLEGGEAADITMFEHPFHFVKPTQPAPKQTYRVCLDSNRKRGGTIDLGNAQLRLVSARFSSANYQIYITGWNSPAEAESYLEFRLNEQTGQAQVTVLRGKAMQRIGMLGTGKATSIAKVLD